MIPVLVVQEKSTRNVVVGKYKLDTQQMKHRIYPKWVLDKIALSLKIKRKLLGTLLVNGHIPAGQECRQ